MTPTILELRAGDLRLALRPDLGGSIAGLWSGDLAVLRSCEPAALEGARLSGCFPFVPYSNRLAHRHFRWLGREYKTAANFGDSPHSIHGVGWQHAWQVESQREHDAVVSYTHAPDDGWPFAFAAKQVFSLTPGALNVGLSITNLAPHAAPVGLGWHPYFPKRARSRLHIELSDRWEHDGSNLPTRRVPQPGMDRRACATSSCRCGSRPRCRTWWSSHRPIATSTASSRSATSRTRSTWRSRRRRDCARCSRASTSRPG
jgi:aldose 1-epimerase